MKKYQQNTVMTYNSLDTEFNVNVLVYHQVGSILNQVEDYQQIATQGSASREATHRKYLLFYFVY